MSEHGTLRSFSHKTLGVNLLILFAFHANCVHCRRGAVCVWLRGGHRVSLEDAIGHHSSVSIVRSTRTFFGSIDILQQHELA